MLRNKRIVWVLCWQGFLLWVLCSYIIVFILKDGTRIDYHTNDYLINTLEDLVFTIPNSNRIVYLSINDKTYKDYFKRNQFDRKLFAEGLENLKKYNPAGIILDLVFAYPSSLTEDSVLEDKLNNLDNLYLPVSFSLARENINFSNQNLVNQNKVLHKFLGQPIINRFGVPLIANKGLFTSDRFLKLSDGTGHISDFSDDDGIYRNSILIVKVDSLYLPSLYFSVFLKELNIPFEKVQIYFGEKIILPVLNESWNNEIIEIPIDQNGRTRIPFVGKWTNDFPNISLSNFINFSNKDSYQGSLSELFEGKFVFVCDISTGIADIGNTSLNQSSPLVVIQSNMLNALLTNTFFKNLKFTWLELILFILIAILTCSTFFYEIKIFYYSFLTILLLYVGIVIYLLHNFQLLPVISFGISLIFSFTFLLIQIQYITQKDKKIIEVENLRKQHEMEEAKKIQLSMLPDKLPIYDGVDIATYISTATEVGGDYYDFFIDKKNNLKFVIADATGHGLQAGTMVTVAKTLFTNFRGNDDYLNILNQMSGIIKQLNLSKLYLCISLFKYKNYTLEFTSAGMPPVFLFKSSDKQIEKFTLKGAPLGFVNHFPYMIKKISLNLGDVLLISSDGLTELFNDKNEMIDEQKIISLFKSNAQESADKIISSIKVLINDWSRKSEPKDDITIIVVKIK